MQNVLKGIGAAAGAVAGLFVRMPSIVRVLVLLMTLDYFSGIGVAIAGRSPKSATGSLNSKIGFIGLTRKAMILVLVLLASILDTFIESAACTGSVTLFYLVNESLSILENAVLLGVPLPAKLVSVLDIAKQAQDKSADKDASDHTPA